MEEYTEQIGIRVSKKQRRKLEKLARARGLKLGPFTRMIVAEYLSSLEE